jgi:hypothetical protein
MLLAHVPHRSSRPCRRPWPLERLGGRAVPATTLASATAQAAGPGQPPERQGGDDLPRLIRHDRSGRSISDAARGPFGWGLHSRGWPIL